MMVAPLYCPHGRRLHLCTICKGTCRNGHDLTAPGALVILEGRERCAACNDAKNARNREKKRRDGYLRTIAELHVGYRPPCANGHDLNQPEVLGISVSGVVFCRQCRGEGARKAGRAPSAEAAQREARMVEEYLELRVKLEREPRAWVREELRNQLAKMAKEMGRE